MGERKRIDITFDVRTDTPSGKDPDTYSETLRDYHKYLWSKPLPCGEPLELDDSVRGHYLLHRSDERGEFSLSSDAVVPSFRYEPMVKAEAVALREFLSIGYTIGGMMLWPGKRVDGMMTINGARGFHPRIKDRFDLTLECIRRHYRGEASPLSAVLRRYAGFFELFVDFRGFVDFFLLQDAVTVDYDAVVFCTPFEDFTTSPVPKTMDEYREYRRRGIAFIAARNRRILHFCAEDHSPGLKRGRKSAPDAREPQKPPVGGQLTREAVLKSAEGHGTRGQLERAMEVAAQKGLRVRPFKTCLMFAPPSDARRCLFTLWAKPEGGGIAAYVTTGAFAEFFPLERTQVAKALGPEGWRHLGESEFDAFLRGVEALDLGS